MGNQTKRIAVVLAGAVAQGAFEAGAIRALVRADVEIVRIVAASSGALNGTVLASGLRRREAIAGAETLATLWRDHAEWNEVFHASFRDLLKRDGISDQKRLLGLLRDHVPPSQPDDPAPINLRLIVAALRGCQGSIGTRPATTFESVRDFHTGDFASSDALEGVFTAAVASSALPLVFAPVEIAGVGPCVDGGAVNNTPMKWALDGALGADIDAVVVVATSVEHRTGAVDLSGFTSYVGHIVSVLIEERLYRDLRESEQTNAGLAALDEMVRRGELSVTQLDRVKRALGLADRRVVNIVTIRPLAPLPGSAFSGFFDADLRAAYLDAGYLRGLEVLGALERDWRRADRAAAARAADVAGPVDPVGPPAAVVGERVE
jgi:NTE family protein